MAHFIEDFRNELAFADNLWDLDLIVCQHRKPLLTEFGDVVYRIIKNSGSIRGCLGRFYANLPFVKQRLLAEGAIERVREYCRDGVTDETDGLTQRIEKGLIPGGVPGSVDVFSAERGVVEEEVVCPYAVGTEQVIDYRDAPVNARRRVDALGRYMRHVVNELIGHFDPEDRASSVGRIAMRKYAYKLMLAHGVRKHDIAKHIDRVVAAAVAKVNAAEQIEQHNVFLGAGCVRRV